MLLKKQEWNCGRRCDIVIAGDMIFEETKQRV